MREALPIILASAVILGGCGQPSGPSVKPVAGYKFEVQGADGAATDGHAETFSVQAGANSAAVRDGLLTVNGKGYGVVADGSSILVEATGKVLVNGTERLPE